MINLISFAKMLVMIITNHESYYLNESNRLGA